MRYSCPRNCGWLGSDEHSEWMAHFCHDAPRLRKPAIANPYTATDVKRDTEAFYVRQFDAPIQKAVDDYILMERKARAWDELVRLVGTVYTVDGPEDLDAIWRRVHSAQYSV